MAAVIFLGVVRSHCVDDGPFPTLPVVVEIHRVFDSLQINLGFVVGPGAKFHFAVLLIEREEGDVDAAGALVNGRWDPADFARVEQVSLRHMGHSELTVSTGDADTMGASLDLKKYKRIKYLAKKCLILFLFKHNGGETSVEALVILSASSSCHFTNRL